jgi:hypothetical protein
MSDQPTLMSCSGKNLMKNTPAFCGLSSADMKFTEEALRRLLSSAHSGAIGHDILDRVAKGEVLTINYGIMEVAPLRDVSDALNHLRDLGWQPQRYLVDKLPDPSPEAGTTYTRLASGDPNTVQTEG